MRRQPTHREPDLTEDDLSAETGLSPRTWQRYRQLGIGPPFYKTGAGRTCAVRYPRAGFDAWRAGLRRTSTSDTGKK